MLVLLVLFPVVVHQDTTHTKIRDDRRMFLLLGVSNLFLYARIVTHREFPEYKVTRVTKTEITCPMQTFADIAAFSDLAAGLVLLFLRCPYFAETQLDIGRKLQGRSME